MHKGNIVLSVVCQVPSTHLPIAEAQHHARCNGFSGKEALLKLRKGDTSNTAAQAQVTRHK